MFKSFIFCHYDGRKGVLLKQEEIDVFFLKTRNIPSLLVKWKMDYNVSCLRTIKSDIISILLRFEYVEVKGMSRISKEQVEHVAHLARLAITEEETEMFTKQLDAIITYAEQLNELDTTGVKPTTHVLEVKNVMREDKPTKGLPREEVLKNAPDHQDGQVRVPSILE